VPEKRLPMRRIREVLRLHFEAKLNERQIAKICSVGKGTVRRYLKRIAGAGLSWPLPADLDDATLEQRRQFHQCRPVHGFDRKHVYGGRR
jgi:transposase